MPTADPRPFPVLVARMRPPAQRNVRTWTVGAIVLAATAAMVACGDDGTTGQPPATILPTGGGGVGGSGATGGSGASGGSGAHGGTGGQGGSEACAPVDPTAPAPHVFWPAPVRAYPDIPFRYTFVAFDSQTPGLCYELEGAPAAMTLDGQGNLSWQPTAADVAASPISFRVHITTTRGGRESVDVSLDVSEAEFLFVAPGGDDAASGAIDAPLATIEEGLARLSPTGAKTLVIRGGTYSTAWDWERNGVHTPLTGKDFAPDAPAEIYGYPGEQVVIECQSGSHGIWSYATSYNLWRDIEIRGASSSERGGALATGSHIVMQRVTVRDSDWPSDSNCAGIYLSGQETVCHRCASHDNYERGGDTGAHWNNSNYIVYTESADADVYILESISSGSVVGFKIKHGGPGKLTLYGSRDDGSERGFGGMDDELSVRWSTFVDNDIGVSLGVTDPSASVMAGNVLVEHITIARAHVGLDIQTGYPATDVVVRANVFHTTETLGTAEGDPHLVRLWPYDPAPPDADLLSDENCFSAPNSDAGFRVGQGSAVGFADWQARDHDLQSAWDAAPFGSEQDWTLTASSSCRLGTGVVAGAHP